MYKAPVHIHNITYRAFNQQSMMTFFCIKITTVEIKIVLQHGKALEKSKEIAFTCILTSTQKTNQTNKQTSHLDCMCEAQFLIQYFSSSPILGL